MISILSILDMKLFYGVSVHRKKECDITAPPLYSGDRAKEMGHWVARGESSGKQGQNAISFFYRTLMALGMAGQISCH